MRIPLAGSSGTIGTRLSEQLLGWHEVTGADIRRNPRDNAGVPSGVP
ncbi:MAG: hypothetical protein NTU41_12525 [Chloroflexi bacterium]|nr:hypothetical protein [Chloroflexota bacterium]